MGFTVNPRAKCWCKHGCFQWEPQHVVATLPNQNYATTTIIMSVCQY